MASNPTEFSTLMQRVQEGSQEAARELVERYGRHILRIVRRRLDERMRTQFDSEDFVQAVWASFFALPTLDGRFDQPETLLHFLMGLARNKVVEAVRQRIVGQKYAIDREVSMDRDLFNGGDELTGPAPSPSAIVIAREEWERMLREQPDDHHQQVLTRIRDGQTQQEVARETGFCVRTIKRILSRLRPQYAHECD